MPRSTSTARLSPIDEPTITNPYKPQAVKLLDSREIAQLNVLGKIHRAALPKTDGRLARLASAQSGGINRANEDS